MGKTARNTTFAKRLNRDSRMKTTLHDLTLRLGREKGRIPQPINLSQSAVSGNSILLKIHHDFEGRVELFCFRIEGVTTQRKPVWKAPVSASPFIRAELR